MATPLSPDIARSRKAEAIPDFVIDSFNELIVENLGTNGVAVVKQDAAIARILTKRLGLSRADLFQRNLLDVEDVFRAAGWKVTYDKPAYCESYPAYFTFEAA
ncbi:hypothetical protein MAL1_00141 [Bacteriophage DSS3_MAL1]|nr:hypothetical protein MAL1_00141 [Bacteriophage DSS3_MAL1]